MQKVRKYMRLNTRSITARKAVAALMRRMPSEAKRQVEQFLCSLVTDRDYQPLGLGGIDYASATLFPFFSRRTAEGNIDLQNYEARVHVTLPIFRLFSPKA